MNLTPALIKLLGDKSAAVVYVSEQAVQLMLPLALQSPAFVAGPCGELLKAIIKAAADNSDGAMAGLIAEQAYRAINPRLWKSGVAPGGAAMGALIDALLNLQTERLKLYKNGVPPNPTADTYAAYLLLTRNGWNAMPKDQQLQAVQNAANLISWAAQRTATVPANQTRELIGALNEQGYWMGQDGLGGIEEDPNLIAAGAALHNLSAAAPSSAVKTTCDAVISELTQIPDFQNLKTPADLSVTATAPAPASTEASP
jgi:hypothetical protein